jgi:glycosyltransferase involved in cell wall biosynthesis
MSGTRLANVMKICFLGLDNLPMLAPEYWQHTIGGESVQQTLLARALARRGHEVSMVAADCGQRDGAQWDGVRVYKAFRPRAGLPVLRFVHPRWTGLWSALKRADADLYYTSCAGVQVGLLALFCRRHSKRFVFRAASDADTDPSRLLVQYARDRWLYAWGLRRAHAILVQSAEQARAMARNYGLASRVAGMLVEPAPPPPPLRDIDVLWVSNVRSVKRPDRILALARRLPGARVHMVGGPLPGEEPLFREIRRIAETLGNVTFHGRLPYWEAGALYDRAKLLINTSDVEGFPNSYLQAWIRGVPVVTLIDPDRVIAREGLGVAAASPADLGDAARGLLENAAAWRAASERCRAYMAGEYGEDNVLSAYLDAFAEVMRGSGADLYAPGRARHA